MPSRSDSTSASLPVVHPTYRPDINGLRAVAVIAVLVFHAFPSLLPGGFVGVDVFFVISGFLISSIIFHNLANDSFSFVDFYARRVRRIFPAVLLVLLVCLGAGWSTLLAQEYAPLGKHIAAGAGFVSNLALWSESGYFDTASSTKPLLHLWSLGIEEQFYLVWPLLLYGAWKKNISLQTTTVLVLLASFGLNLHASGADSAAAYYSPLGRVWELLVGALLAYKLAPPHAAPRMLSRAHVAAAVGLVLVVASMFWVSKEDAFPGWWALLPVVGTALLIGAGSGAWINRHLLSHRLMVWVGLISYPLYLWHWPLLSFAEIIVGTVPTAEQRLLCLLVALVLAWLTFLVVERPYRARNYTLRQPLVLGVCMLVVALVGLNVMRRDGLPFRHEKLSAEKPVNARSAGFTSLGVSIQQDHASHSCRDLMPNTPKKLDSFCHLVGPAPRTAVIGDSHANHLLYGLQNSTDADLNLLLVVGAGGCQPALQGGQSDDCDAQSRANMELVQKFTSIQQVVLSANASWIQTHTAQYETMLQGYLKTASQLQQMGKTVVFLVDTPEFLDSPLTCAPNPLPVRNRFKGSTDLCEKRILSNTVPRDIYNRWVRALRDSNPAIRVVDAYALFCDASECRVMDDNTLLFKDSNHLTDYGSKLIADQLAATLR